MIQEDRIQHLNNQPIRKGSFVIYWMQASQRVEFNHSLEYAIREGNRLKIPVIVYFYLAEDYPDANQRHYLFMLEGLREIQKVLKNLNIGMIISQDNSKYPQLVKLSQSAALLVTDCGYTAYQRNWRISIAKEVKCLMVQVESDIVVPVKSASPKEEYSAATLRKKLSAKVRDYLVPFSQTTPEYSSLNFHFPSFPITDINDAILQLKIDGSVKPSPLFSGGTAFALRFLEDFLHNKLNGYNKYRNDPSKNYNSYLSPYLHFGQISPVYIALRIIQNDTEGTDTFLEELIVRRELAINFVYYNSNYMKYCSLPSWAQKTLEKHKQDPREYIYTIEQLEQANTHDPYWNAAQWEMMVTGKMHGYMRMYWGKKILEWIENPEIAFEIALYLNNKYQLDGRDPNGFTGVAWCFGKHDRPWAERPIFGNVRYMNANGLKRKFDIDLYLKKVQNIKKHLNYI